MTTKRAWGAALSLAVFALLIAGCGSDDNGDSASQATSTPTATAVQTTATKKPTKPAKPTPAPPATTKPPSGPAAPARVVVPDLAGKSLADAQSALSAAGLTFTAEAKSGDRTQIRSNWEVCQTVPKAGKRAPNGSPITLITAAPGGC